MNQIPLPTQAPKSKNYLTWIPLKAKINNKKTTPSFKTRDVFWCYIGENIGCEEDGKGELFSRPVVIIKVFNKDFCLIVPLTTKIKQNKYYIQFEFNERQQSAMISQIRSIDSKRLKSKIGTLSNKDFTLIQSEISKFWQK